MTTNQLFPIPELPDAVLAGLLDELSTQERADYHALPDDLKSVFTMLAVQPDSIVAVLSSFAKMVHICRTDGEPNFANANLADVMTAIKIGMEKLHTLVEWVHPDDFEPMINAIKAVQKAKMFAIGKMQVSA